MLRSGRASLWEGQGLRPKRGRPTGGSASEAMAPNTARRYGPKSRLPSAVPAELEALARTRSDMKLVDAVHGRRLSGARRSVAISGSSQLQLLAPNSPPGWAGN